MTTTTILLWKIDSFGSSNFRKPDAWFCSPSRTYYALLDAVSDGSSKIATKDNLATPPIPLSSFRAGANKMKYLNCYYLHFAEADDLPTMIYIPRDFDLSNYVLYMLPRPEYCIDFEQENGTSRLDPCW